MSTQLTIPDGGQSNTQDQTREAKLNAANEAFNIIIQSLNKACKTGVYNLDEAYLIKHNLIVLQNYLSS